MRCCAGGGVLMAMVAMVSAQVPNAGMNAAINPNDINSLLKAQINGEDTAGVADLGALQSEQSRQQSVLSAVATHSPVMDISGVALDPLSTTGFSADPDDLTVDGEVVCQTVKEALLALETVSADQLKAAATYEGNQAATEAAPVEPLGRKLLGRGANLQDKSVPASMDVHMITLPNGQTVPAACPGEIAGLNFGSCLNYFFTVNCVHDHQGLIDDLIGPGPGMRPKTLDDYRQVVISIFKSVPPCTTSDQGATVTREHTCQDSVERLGAMQYPQLIRNAIAKVEAQLSPTNTEAMRTVSATMKQFANLASPQATVMVASPLDDGASRPSEDKQGEESAEEETQQPVKYSSPLAKSMPIFVCILALALGAIALAVYYLRKEELFDRMDQISRVTQGYAKMMTETVEASSAAFSTSSTSTLSSRADRGTTGKRAASTIKDVTVEGAEDAIPALQAKLNLLREVTASAYDNAL